MLISIIVFLISLSTVIMIHELGHFIMAKRAGILCHEFSIGMGPLIWSTKKGETVYAIRAIPIGGYVMMAGEEVDDEMVKPGMTVKLAFDQNNVVTDIILDTDHPDYNHLEDEVVKHVNLKGKDNTPLTLNGHTVKRDAMLVMKNRSLQIAPFDRSFESKSVLERFLAIFAGPFMNFVLALVVFLTINLYIGVPNLDSTELGSITPDYPAEDVLEVGDIVTAIDGTTVNSWSDISTVLDSNPGDRNLTFDIERDNQTLSEQIIPTLFVYSIGFHSAPNVGSTLEIGQV
ncbi:MAG: site-2 protease family protein, partial [Candidatus Izimaplasma sp.]|nr:site-2 protease family protein [Candidatus Izimaplasma bacterium]